MEIIQSEVFDALGKLFIAAIVYSAYDLTRNAQGAKKKVLLKGLAWCVIISLFAASILGKPSCEYSSDSYRGGCDEYVDDEFIPTTEQRLARFMYFLTLLGVPVTIAALKREDGEK